jgi:predicted MFS family arabinose efflux permease
MSRSIAIAILFWLEFPLQTTKPVAVLTPLWVVVGLAMGPAVALGLSRFAYALLLPPMRADLGWSFADAGALNTSNAAGYLVSALVAAPFGKRMGDKPLFAVSLLLTALAVGARVSPLTIQCFWRCV